MTKINVAIVDDNKSFSFALKQMLEQCFKEKINTIQIAENGEDFLVLFRKKKIDLVFMDIEMPKMDGITATRIATAENRYVTIIGTSNHSSIHFITHLLEAGAKSYIIKEDINEVEVARFFN